MLSPNGDHAIHVIDNEFDECGKTIQIKKYKDVLLMENHIHLPMLCDCGCGNLVPDPERSKAISNHIITWN